MKTKLCKFSALLFIPMRIKKTHILSMRKHISEWLLEMLFYVFPLVSCTVNFTIVVTNARASFRHRLGARDNRLFNHIISTFRIAGAAVWAGVLCTDVFTDVFTGVFNDVFT